MIQSKSITFGTLDIGLINLFQSAYSAIQNLKVFECAFNDKLLFYFETYYQFYFNDNIFSWDLFEDISFGFTYQ